MFKYFAIFLFLLVPTSSFSQSQENRVSTDTQNQYENLSLTRVEQRSRDAAVKVKTLFGYGSGTYTTIAGSRVVLTAAHVVDGENTVEILGRAGETVPGRVVYRDAPNDFAVISVPEMQTRSPMEFKIARRFSGDNIIGRRVCYTGFPNHHDLLTIRGSIAGNERGYVILQTYAWMGASGSGVFDTSGNYVGTLVAVDLGRYRGMSQIVESVVWVVPIQNIDMAAVRSALRRNN